jgi:hypothetical protein
MPPCNGAGLRHGPFAWRQMRHGTKSFAAGFALRSLIRQRFIFRLYGIRKSLQSTTCEDGLGQVGLSGGLFVWIP